MQARRLQPRSIVSETLEVGFRALAEQASQVILIHAQV